MRQCHAISVLRLLSLIENLSQSLSKEVRFSLLHHVWDELHAGSVGGCLDPRRPLRQGFQYGVRSRPTASASQVICRTGATFERPGWCIARAIVGMSLTPSQMVSSRCSQVFHSAS